MRRPSNSMDDRCIDHKLAAEQPSDHERKKDTAQQPRAPPTQGSAWTARRGRSGWTPAHRSSPRPPSLSLFRSLSRSLPLPPCIPRRSSKQWRLLVSRLHSSRLRASLISSAGVLPENQKSLPHPRPWARPPPGPAAPPTGSSRRSSRWTTPSPRTASPAT